MSAIFLILPLEQDSDLQIEPHDYADKICTRWPGSHAITHDPTDSALYMEIASEKAGGFSFLCDLHTDLKTVAFGYYPREIFYEYIVWHRSYVPEKYRLELFADFAGEGIELSKDTALEALIDYVEG